MDTNTSRAPRAFHDFASVANALKGDPSASALDDLPLVDSPWPTAAILATYWVLVKYVGPSIMKKRDPFDIKKSIMCYNIFQIVANSAIFYWSLREIFRPDNDLYCLQPSKESAMLCYFYFLNKFADLTETMFFLLKKSWRQISHLHLYHHVAMVICCYIDLSVQPGGLSMYMLLFNTLVHVVMYSYYFLSSLKLNSPLLPMIKRSVTQIQLVQFVTCLVIVVGTALFVDCADKKPWTSLFLAVGQLIYFLYIFGGFYAKTYKKSE